VPNVTPGSVDSAYDLEQDDFMTVPSSSVLRPGHPITPFSTSKTQSKVGSTSPEISFGKNGNPMMESLEDEEGGEQNLQMNDESDQMDELVEDLPDDVSDELELEVEETSLSAPSGAQKHYLSPSSDPAFVRERAKQERMRAVAAALHGQPLNPTEQALVRIHREQLEEMAQLLREEAKLLDGAFAPSSSDSPMRPRNHPLTRGDMARYSTTLADVLRRKFVMVEELSGKVEDYMSAYGAQIGLVDPLSTSPFPVQFPQRRI
jgi:hypothetical protein